MTLFFLLICFFIAWVWVDYYRLIDLYERESLKFFALSFGLGCLTVLPVFWAQFHLFPVIGLDRLELNGSAVNDFLYATVRVALTEELAKMLPILLLLWLMPRIFNEPIDYIAFICTSALGFSAVENFLYFNEFGAGIISGRAVLATMGHMIDSSFIAYGLVLYHYRRTRRAAAGLLMWFGLAVLMHGLYDFFLMWTGLQGLGVFLTIFVFLLGISLFAVMLNNALNNSTFFTYKKVINSGQVTTRLVAYYAVIFVAQTAVVGYHEGYQVAFNDLQVTGLAVGSIVFVSAVRLGRFKLVKGRWFPLRVELPFSLTIHPNQLNRNPFQVRVKGEAYNEAYINAFYEEYFELAPIVPNSVHLVKPRTAFIEKKYHLRNDATFYVARVYDSDQYSGYTRYLLKPKTHGTHLVDDQHPIVALIPLHDEELLEKSPYTFPISLLEWAVIRGRKE